MSGITFSPDETGPNIHIMVHHYCSEEFLFQTITMYDEDERERVYQEIVENKNWYWGRFKDGHRAAYMKKRIMAKSQMYRDFSEKYWSPKERCPVYFYLYPDFSKTVIEQRLLDRHERDEPHTKYLLVDTRDLDDVTNISFTISDSLTSYKRKLIRQGAEYNGSIPITEYVDHGTIFHIGEIAQLIEKYEDKVDLHFEVQVWDRNVLNKWLKRKIK